MSDWPHIASAGSGSSGDTAFSEKLFSDTMIDSMPGVLYFYDTRGQFLRWNKNFERITGYSGEEILTMHPLEFFAPEEKNLIAERIVEVFEKGESSVEASFLAKDGTRTLYFFTGRRVMYKGTPCLVGVGIDISERKRAENALEASETKYRELVESANSIILRWNSSGEITFLNEYGLRFFGYRLEEIIGKHVMDTIVPSTEKSGRDLRRLMEQICADPKAFEQNVNENIKRDGERATIAWTNRIVQDARGNVMEILSIGTDITERQRAESALQEIQARFEVVVENLREGLIISTTDGNLIHWNAAAMRMYGFKSAIEAYVPLADLAKVFELSRLDGTVLTAEQWPFARVRRGETVHGLEIRIRRLKGNWERIFSYTGSIAEYGDDKKLAFLTVQDITERKQAEMALQILNKTLELEVAKQTSELKAALVRAEAADRVKSSFLATMSHELRTPLNSIIGFTGIVLQGLAGPLNAEQLKQLGMVRSSARHLLELINDVLDISKIEAGQLDVRTEPFDLTDSLDRVAASVRPLADKKGLALVCKVNEPLGQMVNDRRRLEQILINLLSNAIKFTEHGQVTLTAMPVENYSASRYTTPGPAIRFEIADTGIGIKPEDLNKLFQPFRQIDTGLARQHEGTGLGLMICRRLATLMGGEISVVSEWSKGSVFKLTLPLSNKPV